MYVFVVAAATVGFDFIFHSIRLPWLCFYIYKHSRAHSFRINVHLKVASHKAIRFDLMSNAMARVMELANNLSHTNTFLQQCKHTHTHTLGLTLTCQKHIILKAIAPQANVLLSNVR